MRAEWEIPFARRGPTSESGPSMRAVRDLPIPPAERWSMKKRRYMERECRGLLASCARGTRTLGRCSFDTRNGSPNRPPCWEGEGTQGKMRRESGQVPFLLAERAR